MNIHYGFAPDPCRARQLDRFMHVKLGESLRHLSEECAAVIPHDASRLAVLADSLDRGERQSPAVFAHYYRLLNEGVNRSLGGLHSARLIIQSVDFHDFVTNNTAGRWDLTLELMRGACRALVAGGAEGIMLCANTAHAVIGPAAGVVIGVGEQDAVDKSILSTTLVR